MYLPLSQQRTFFLLLITLDDITSLANSFASLVDFAYEAHVFFAPPGLRLSIPRVRNSDPLHGTCIPFVMQHSLDSQHRTESIHGGSG
jgi:hypothetical protein